MEEELLNRPVVMTDATVVTVNGKRGYIRNFSMEKGVRCHAMKDKTLKAMGGSCIFCRSLRGSLCMTTRQPFIILEQGMGNATPISCDT